MTQSIYLRLEVPFEKGTEKEGMAGSHADLQRLLAKSRLRVVSSKAGKPPQQSALDKLSIAAPEGEDDFDQPVKSLEEVERDYIVEILSRSGGNRSKAAKMLNISRRTLQRKMALFD